MEEKVDFPFRNPFGNLVTRNYPRDQLHLHMHNSSCENRSGCFKRIILITENLGKCRQLEIENENTSYFHPSDITAINVWFWCFCKCIRKILWASVKVIKYSGHKKAMSPPSGGV